MIHLSLRRRICDDLGMRKELRGYDPTAVDAFLGRCLATPGVYRSRFPQLRGRIPGGRPVTPDEVRDVRFPTALWGYPIRAVDALLDELQAAVEVTTWRAPALPDAAEPAPRTIVLVDTEPGSLAHAGAHRPPAPRGSSPLPDRAP